MLAIFKHLFFILSFIIFSTSVHSESDITLKLGYQTVDGNYSNASIKESISSNGTIVNAEYLEDLNITHTSTDTLIKFKTLPDIVQTSKFTSVGYNFYTDKYGKINLRADYQSIYNDDESGATDNVRINSYQASILPYDDSYYAEIGFSKSKYPYIDNTDYSTPLTVKQFNVSYAKSPTGVDWLTLKAYRFNSSDKARSYSKDSHNALEIKYKYFLADNVLKIDNIEVSTLLGRRIFAVDSVSGSAYNTLDLQRGSIGLNAEWRLGENINFLASISTEEYQSDANIAYTGNYKYFNFNYSF